MNKRFTTIARGVAAISAVAIVAVGATFAALTSNPVTLSNNSVTVATPGLQIGKDGTFSTIVSGFSVTGMYPGAGYKSAGTFQLKNTGDVPLILNVKVPFYTDGATLPSSKLSVALNTSNLDGSGGGVNGMGMASLLGTSGVNLAPQIAPGQTINVVLQFSIASGTDVTSGATSGNFNFVITGTQPTTP
jgi:hypothetical protein